MSATEIASQGTDDRGASAPVDPAELERVGGGAGVAGDGARVGSADTARS